MNHHGDDYTRVPVTLLSDNKRLRWIDFAPGRNAFYVVDLGRVREGDTVEIPRWFETKLRHAGFAA